MLGFCHGPALLEQGTRRAHLDTLAATCTSTRLPPGRSHIGDDTAPSTPIEDVPGVGLLDLIAHPDASGAKDAAVVVDHKPLVACVDLHHRLERRQIEMSQAELLGRVLQLAVIVGDAYRADVVPLHEEHLDDRPAVVVERGRVGHYRHTLLDLGHAGR